MTFDSAEFRIKLEVAAMLVLSVRAQDLARV